MAAGPLTGPQAQKKTLRQQHPNMMSLPQRGPAEDAGFGLDRLGPKAQEC